MATRVLIADPDRCLLAYYKKQLLEGGFEVATACDGLECLRQLRDFTPDVLVLEPAIPWGGGDGIVTMLHEDDDLPEVPTVLLLTYGCGPAVLYNIAPFPISDFRTKPMDGRWLVRWIRSVLSRQAAEVAEMDAVEGGRR